jgi:hypothetical protein
MQRALPKRKQKRALAALAVIAALIAAALATSGAAARPTTTAVIPNGTYGVLGSRGDYVVFTVRNRRVRNLNFNIQITCQASDSPISEQRFFSAGAEAPQGRLIPSNGKLILNWQERGDGRLGQVHVELKFGVRDVANFGVIVPEERTPETGPEDALESCDGVDSLRFHRGFELPPLPY